MTVCGTVWHMQFNRHAFKAIREGQGISKADIGRAIGKDRTLVSRYETGDRQPSIPDIVGMAKVLRVSTLAITGEGEEVAG